MYLNLGIIGMPLKHTLSPLIHSYFLNETGLCGGYNCYDTIIDDLPDLINFFQKYSFIGVNVTVPYKEEIINFCDELDITAQEIGAVNTLHFIDNKIIGHNTDIFGFHMMLENNNISTLGKRVLLLGAGGASRSVIPYLHLNPPREFIIANRTIEKAENLAFLYGDYVDIADLSSLKGMEFDIVINTTSMSLKGEPFQDFGFCIKEAAIDMIYTPQETPFLALYKDKNIKRVNGVDMLLYQALGSFNIWTGKKVNINKEFLYNQIYK